MRNLWKGAVAAAVACASLGLAACGSEGSAADPTVVSVPGQAPTITAALAKVTKGGVVLVHPGHYDEQVTVTKPGVTIRGTDRNKVVVDAQGRRPYGIVVLAPGVRVENLTVANATLYGLLFTGVQTDGKPVSGEGSRYGPPNAAKFPPLQRFLANHVTAVDNGLYGVYAFDAQHGVIEDSLASGSADSGFYVGQCRHCDIAVTKNIASHNAVGFENANASDSLVIAGNRFADNRVGLTLLSNFQEAFTPQTDDLVVGNLVADNNSADSPEQADGGFGIGIGIGGGTDNHIVQNRIDENHRAGLLLQNTANLPAAHNAFTDNVLDGNGVDYANISDESAAAIGNCPTGDKSPSTSSTLPSDLFRACAAHPETAANPTTAPDRLPAQKAPPGVDFLDVTHPPAQPTMPADSTVPPPLPATVKLPTTADYPVPDSDLLAGQVGQW